MPDRYIVEREELEDPENPDRVLIDVTWSDGVKETMFRWKTGRFLESGDLYPIPPKSEGQ